jgi:hypothetical protein
VVILQRSHPPRVMRDRRPSHRLEILAVDGWWHPGDGRGGWPTFDARSEGEAQGKTAWAKALTYFNGTAT